MEFVGNYSPMPSITQKMVCFLFRFLFSSKAPPPPPLSARSSPHDSVESRRRSGPAVASTPPGKWVHGGGARRGCRRCCPAASAPRRSLHGCGVRTGRGAPPATCLRGPACLGQGARHLLASALSPPWTGAGGDPLLYLGPLRPASTHCHTCSPHSLRSPSPPPPRTIICSSS